MSTPPIVIIADRDPIVTNALRVEFNYRDFVVLLALSAAEAEDYAAQTVANLIVLDVGSFRLAGYDACARIRRRDGYAKCPIILTAANVSARMTEAADKAGATGVLAKSYSFSDLIRTVLPHVANDDPIAKQLAGSPGLAQNPPQQEWSRGSAFSWRFGNDSRLAGNARLMPVVRAAGVKIPLVKTT